MPRGRWRPMLVSLLVLGATTANASPPDDDLNSVLARITDAPRTAAPFADLAGLLFRHGELARAAEAAREAARLDPKNARHRLLLGYILAAAGRDAGAERAFSDAADLDASAHAALADLHVAWARAEYDRALRQGVPDDAIEERLRDIDALADGVPELTALIRAEGEVGGPSSADMVPPIYLGPEVDVALVVEKRTQTVRVYRRVDDGSAALERTYPCTTGASAGAKEVRGDLRTPDGVYVITGMISGDVLPSKYGTLALPLSYPNAWDRHLGRGGFGIWLHGSDRLSAPFTPRETKGCIILRNDDLVALAARITPGFTPILIAEDVPYYDRKSWRELIDLVDGDAQPSASDRRSTESLASAATAAPAQKRASSTGTNTAPPTPQMIALARDHALIARRDGPDLVYEYSAAEPTWHTVATARDRAISARAWAEQLAQLKSPPAELERVSLTTGGDTPPVVVIETSAAAEVRGFRPDGGRRLHLDLRGVRADAVPSVVPIGKSPVRRIRVAMAQWEPPVARIAIDLDRPMDYRAATDGNRIEISLVPLNTRR